MRLKPTARPCLSAMVAACLGLTGTSGLLMLVHLRNGSIVTLHQWAGLLLVIGGALHLALNRRAFLAYCKLPLARATLCGVTLLAIVLAVIGAGRRGAEHRGRGWRRSALEKNTPSSASRDAYRNGTGVQARVETTDVP